MPDDQIYGKCLRCSLYADGCNMAGVGGLSYAKIKRVAAIAVTAGLLAFGAIAVSAGVANASTGLITACSTSDQVLAPGFIPNCTSSGVITNPTSIVLTVNSPKLTALIDIVGEGIEDQWTLTCGAGGGASFTRSGVLTVTSKRTSTSKVSLRTCTEAADQEWTQSPSGGMVTLASDGGECLTDPSATNGTQLTVARCANTPDQRWKTPNVAAPLSRRPPNRYRYAAPTRGGGPAPSSR
jgi:hypothetical protein